MRSEKNHQADQDSITRLHALLASVTNQIRRTHALLDGVERRLADMNRNSEQNQEAGWRIAA